MSHTSGNIEDDLDVIASFARWRDRGPDSLHSPL